MAHHRSVLKHGAGAITHHRSTLHHRTYSAAQRKAMSDARKGKKHPHIGHKKAAQHQ